LEDNEAPVTDIELDYKNLNIGRTLTCLLYSFKTDTPCILTDPLPPFKFDENISKFDFSFLGINKNNPHQAWDRLCFILSMSGLLLFPHSVTNYRVENKRVTLFVNNNQKINIKYKKLNTFDEIESGWSYVYDFFDWKSGSLHDNDFVQDVEDNFIKKIIFYSSERERVNKQVKDLVGISYLNNVNLEDMEVSPTYSRLKMLRMLKDNNIKGRISGYNSRGEGVYTSPIIEFSKRIVKPDIKPKISLKEVYNMPVKKGYSWKLLEKIIQHTST